jgi:hypothetical protein
MLTISHSFILQLPAKKEFGRKYTQRLCDCNSKAVEIVEYKALKHFYELTLCMSAWI